MRRLIKRCMGLLIAVTSMFSLASCGNSSKGTINIGILQYATHGALNSANEGFVDGLKEAGYEDGVNIKINYENPEGDSATMSSLAKNMVRQNELILGIATPAATALQAAAKAQNSDCKILFTAVTDPASSSLVASNSVPGGNITGTSDMNPVELQISMLQDVIPNLTKIGIMYTVSESNSKVQADLAEEQAKKMGIECVVNTVTSVTDIAQVTRSLKQQGVQVIYIPTDNLLASNMTSVTNVAYGDNPIPVACGESNMVDAGGTFAVGVNYYNLGKLTAEMAVRILKGEDTKNMAVEYLSSDKYSLTINEDALVSMGLTISEETRNKYK